MKVAIFHPWIKAKGGAERVVLEMAKALNADVYTWVYSKDKTFNDFEKIKVIEVGPRFLKFNPDSFFKRGLYLITSLFSKIDKIKNYDLFIISTSGISEFILLRNKNENTIAYVHTPLRAAYDLYNYYKKNFGILKKVLLMLFSSVYRFIDERLYKRFNLIICNSNETKRRLIKYRLAKKIKVIYPGVSIKKLGKIKYEKFFFYPSRYTPLKRQDLAVKAFNLFSKRNRDYKLILVGSIRDKKYFEKLKQIKNDRVILKDGISNEELDKLYRNCFMVLYFPVNEDFGMVPIEAMSYNKSVIAADEGGYKEIVKRGFNFLVKPDIKKIADKMEYCVKNRNKIIKNSKKNSEIAKELSWKNFSKKIKEVIKNEVFSNVV